MIKPADFGDRHFGIGVDPLDSPNQILVEARMAEDLGFGSFWIADSPFLWREAYVLMAALATRTSELLIGSGVTNPLTRHLSVIASAFATLDELAPGRVILGIGSGDSAVRLAGQAPVRPEDFEESIRCLTALLDGEKRLFGRQSVGLAFPRRVPLYVAATGPRALKLAARSADGVILGFLTDPDLIRNSRQVIEAEAQASGRDLSRFQYLGWIPCCVDEDGENARTNVRVHVARHLLHRAATPADIDPTIIHKLRGAYQYTEHMHPDALHAELVPKEIVDRFAFAGTPHEVTEQAARVLEAGLDHLVVVPRGDKGSVMRKFADEVVPNLGRRYRLSDNV